jgi:DNA modification methylase
MIINGNSLEELKQFPDNYFHSVVTDPPYGLSFMGKKWDYDVPSVEIWQEVFRVLKEGGYLLSFAGTRTQHRMAVNIEDAGFEIRDMIAWVYGSGFPKSHNIGKAIDKNNGKYKIDLTDFGNYIKEKREVKRYSRKQLDDIMETCTAVSWWEGRKTGVQLPSKKMYKKLKKVLDLDNKFDDLIDWAEAERKVIGKKKTPDGKDFDARQPKGWANAGFDGIGKTYGSVHITAPTTEEAKQWEGWGTALKPALEPITMARKPFKTSVAENVLKNGVGGINIDGCRVELENGDKKTTGGCTGNKSGRVGYFQTDVNPKIKEDNSQGRFPANFIHDGSDEVTDLLEESSRFFYCAKASKKDREENNNHPTVKPTDLMRYLVRLVTPKNGIVLDCFMGSGSTGKACALEGFEFVGIDLDKDYCEIAKARIDKAIEDKKQDEAQKELF